jgi:O-antigen/teichoic acid export membrane protein
MALVADRTQHFTGLRISHGALLNLAGHVLPLAAAVLVVPPLLGVLGSERFGFLALAWALVGYFSFLDLGLGRALSRIVAERLGTPREAGLPRLSGSTMTLSALLGVVAGLLLYACAGWLCNRVLDLPPDIAGEAVPAVQILAACLPLVTLTAALRGVLEGARRFGWINAIRVPLGILTFAAPLGVAHATVSLWALCTALCALRVVALAAHWWVCASLLHGLGKLRMPTREAALELFGFGAWVTVSNLVGSIMVYIDRFVIGAQVSIAAVAFYTAPYEVLTRLGVIPAALSGALYPVLAATSPAQARLLHRKAVLMLLVTAVPLALVAALLAPFWMSLWLGDEYARQGAGVAQWLAAGVAANCLAQVPFTLLQARGRADLPGKLHIAELPFYLVVLFPLIRNYGIEGAAMAWFGRCAADAVLLFALARRELVGLAMKGPG